MWLTLNAVGVSLSITCLFTALFALKFRYWRNPKIIFLYALVIFLAQWWCHSILPIDAFGHWLTILCFSLTVPVVLAIILIDRHERKMGRTEG